MDASLVLLITRIPIEVYYKGLVLKVIKALKEVS
jgi:hypothetical protein